jgi:MFS family permease
MNTLVFPFQQMLSVLARDVLHVGPVWLGLLVSTEGLGALVGSLVLAARGERRHARTFALSSLVSALCVVALTASPWYTLCLAIQLVSGLAEAGFGTMQSAILLLAAPEHARGRAMGILSACIGTQPLGVLWVGLLTGWIGAPLAGRLDATVAFLLVLPVAIRLVRQASHLTLPGRPV